MDVQLRTLILEPRNLLQKDSLLVLLIDGLDECEGRNIQQEILHLIQSTADDQFCRLRILVASRPEAHIKETFEAEFFQRVTHTTNIQQSFEDIRTYLCDEFLRIHREHSTMKNISIPWPSPQILEILVERSSGYFVYAATVIKFVGDEYSWPSKQLDIVVQNLIPHDSESPFATLDQLYMQILSRVPRYHPTLCDILCVKIYYPQNFTMQDIDALLGLELGTVELIIRPLHSVLKVPALSRGLLGVHHASFLDFLKDEARSSCFYVGSEEYKSKLGHSILRALSYTHDDPQKNLANLDLYRNLSRISPAWIEYITSISPSADLVPFVQLVNPDFVFYSNFFRRQPVVENFPIWLKKIHPVPEALIQRWDDYHFVLLYEAFQEKVVKNIFQEHRKQDPKPDDSYALARSLGTIHAFGCQVKCKP
ncbi:hypothetical protein B0H14DRAFT_2512685 [Mycena olivaceomarginata]|nr:hypothetical protein B0H14DRAFT_2512685 [Mycena olivaceomarginata]